MQLANYLYANSVKTFISKPRLKIRNCINFKHVTGVFELLPVNGIQNISGINNNFVKYQGKGYTNIEAINPGN